VGGGGEPVEGAAIVNDRFWKDTSGTPIYSQGGGLLQVGDTYYWYGVKYGGAVTYAADPHGKHSDISFQGITTYSSKDLVNWKHEATDKPSNTGGWFGRLGVAYNAKTKKYVAAAQGGGGLYFATSDQPNGGFVFDNVQKDLPGIASSARVVVVEPIGTSPRCARPTSSRPKKRSSSTRAQAVKVIACSSTRAATTIALRIFTAGTVRKRTACQHRTSKARTGRSSS
jgi:hypothetical protein